MDINHFITLRPFLYHLTDRENFKNLIKNGGVLFSTKELVQRSSLPDEEKKEFIIKRRPKHEVLNADGMFISIRDQRPISISNLEKCIPKDWTVGDYIKLLNKWVFFWPTLHRLTSHYTRYSSEKPIIIKIDTSSLFTINDNPKFCRLNSGATRSNVAYNGAPPPRGYDTFLNVYDYSFSPSTVAEVTFADSCTLPNKVHFGGKPEGPWKDLTFEL